MHTRHLHFALLFSILAACSGSKNTTGPTGTPASITLSTTAINLWSLNQTQTLTATVKDAGGTTISANVTWSSTVPAVASVATSGQVTALANGTAKIIATAGTAQDTADVTVLQVPATLTLTPDTLRFPAVGDTATIGRMVRDALGSSMTGVTVTFTTSNAAIATVNSAGQVAAAGNGATTVTGQVSPGGSNLTKSVRVEVGAVLPPAYLVGGYLSTVYTDQVGPVVGTGGAFTYAVTAGALPNGLSLNASTGQITGTPSASGAFFFQVTASNGVNSPSERYAITISTKPANAFNLWVTYNGGVMPSANAQTALSAALARWEQVVTGEVANVTYPSSGLTPLTCSLIDASLLNGAVIDDVSILMAIGTLDGPSKVLAQGGPCGYGRNPAPPAVITGQMLLDVVDQSSATTTYLQDVIWHEIGHVLGIGTIWQNLTTGAGTPTVLYNGTNGVAEWQALGGPSAGGPSNSVPLEPDLGAHWHEAWFNEEIMTPTTELPSVRMPISRMTIATLLDLGWGAVLGAADAYTLPGCAGGCTVSTPGVAAPSEGVRIDDFVIDSLLPLPPGAIEGR